MDLAGLSGLISLLFTLPRRRLLVFAHTSGSSANSVPFDPPSLTRRSSTFLSGQKDFGWDKVILVDGFPLSYSTRFKFLGRSFTKSNSRLQKNLQDSDFKDGPDKTHYLIDHRCLLFSVLRLVNPFIFNSSTFAFEGTSG